MLTKRSKFWLFGAILILIVFAQIRNAAREFDSSLNFSSNGFAPANTTSGDWNRNTPGGNIGGGNIGGTRECFYYNDPNSGSSVMTGC